MDTYLVEFLSALAVAGAAFIQSITGFGFAILSAPLLMFFYDVKTVVILSVILGFFCNVTQAVVMGKNACWRIVGWLLVGGIIGQQLGLIIYHLASGDDLKLAITLVILFSITFMQFCRVKLMVKPLNSVITGLISGIMAVTTGMAGPPLIIYFLCAKLSPKEIRSTSVTYFLLSNITAITTFYTGDAPVKEVLSTGVYLVPALLMGIFLGHWAFKYIPAAMFKKIVYALLYGMCIYNIYGILGK